MLPAACCYRPCDTGELRLDSSRHLKARSDDCTICCIDADERLLGVFRLLASLIESARLLYAVASSASARNA